MALVASRSIPNRICWNCKHFAPDNRATSIAGDCCCHPPRSSSRHTPLYAFPRMRGNVEWCGEWERNLKSYPLPTASGIIAPTNANTVREIVEFAESNNLGIPDALKKDKAKLLEHVLKEIEEV